MLLGSSESLPLVDGILQVRCALCVVHCALCVAQYVCCVLVPSALRAPLHPRLGRQQQQPEAQPQLAAAAATDGLRSLAARLRALAAWPRAQIGTWQSLLLIELDGPRSRRVGVHVMGET